MYDIRCFVLARYMTMVMNYDDGYDDDDDGDDDNNNII